MSPLLPVAFAAMLIVQATPAERPEFSGVWTMDRSRSEAAAQEQPSGEVTVAITQTPSRLQIATHRGGRTEVVNYPVEASPLIPTDINGRSRAFWQGASLVNEGSVDIDGRTVTYREKRTLADGGAEMAVETTLKVQHGYEVRGAQTMVTGKNVYVRSGAPISSVNP